MLHVRGFRRYGRWFSVWGQGGSTTVLEVGIGFQEWMEEKAESGSNMNCGNGAQPDNNLPSVSVSDCVKERRKGLTCGGEKKKFPLC